MIIKRNNSSKLRFMKSLAAIVTIALTPALLLSCHGNSNNNEEGTDTMEIILTDSVVVDSSMVAPADTAVAQQAPRLKHPGREIIVDKTNCRLTVVDNGTEIFSAPITCGRYRGDKKQKDDRRTPEGTFQITHIHDASGWLYHTDDGRWVPKVYGPWFLRLSANGWQGIGIHGTNAPGQIGKRLSKGCIRMKNEDITKLHAMAEVGMKVRVLPDGKSDSYTPSKTSSTPKHDIAKEADKQEMNETPAAPETPAATPQEKETAPAPEPTPAPAPSPVPTAEPIA